MRDFTNATAFFLAGLFAVTILRAQDWQPIPQNELLLNQAPYGLRHNAILLYRSVMFDDQKKISEHHIRIKVLTEEGRGHANIEIPFVKGLAEITDLRARTVGPGEKIEEFEGSAYEKTVVQAGKLKYLAKTFTLPDVQAGSILEYRYTEKRRVGSATTWELQSELYTLHARFSIRPAKSDAGLFGPPTLRWTPINVRQGIDPKLNPDGTVTLEINDVPAFESEAYTLPERELLPRFEFYYLPSVVPVEMYWKELFRVWCEEEERFLGQAKDLKAAAASIVSISDSAEQKLSKIYAHVQRMRNLNHEGGLTLRELKREDIKENKNAQDVWRRGYGTGADLDRLFVALARAAGFDAFHIRYVGRNRGLFHRDLPDHAQFNGTLAMVRVKKASGSVENIFLDPAVPFLRYGMLDWDSTGVVAVHLHSGGGELINIPNRPEWGGTTLRKAVFDLDNSGNLSGTVTVFFSGQDALWRRKLVKERGLDEIQKNEDLEETIKAWVADGAQVKLLKTSGWDDAEESLTAEFSLKILNFAASTARRLIVPTTVLHTRQLLQAATRHATRTFGYYFDYTRQEEDDITIRLAPGMEVEELPAPVTKEMPKARYQSSSEKQPGVLRMKRNLAIDGIYYQDTDVFRKFLSGVRVSDENMILVHKREREGSR